MNELNPKEIKWEITPAHSRMSLAGYEASIYKVHKFVVLEDYDNLFALYINKEAGAQDLEAPDLGDYVIVLQPRSALMFPTWHKAHHGSSVRGAHVG